MKAQGFPTGTRNWGGCWGLSGAMVTRFPTDYPGAGSAGGLWSVLAGA